MSDGPIPPDLELRDLSDLRFPFLGSFAGSAYDVVRGVEVPLNNGYSTQSLNLKMEEWHIDMHAHATCFFKSQTFTQKLRTGAQRWQAEKNNSLCSFSAYGINSRLCLYIE